MSVAGESSHKTKLKDTLYNAMPEGCLRCIDARMAVCAVVSVGVVDSEATLAQGLDEFTEYMSMCSDGAATEGTCGTKRTVCQHPNRTAMLVDVGEIFSN